MIDTFVRGILGTAGSRLLDFYLQNSLWINILLFTYAMLVVFARRNYSQVAQYILAGFIQKHGDKLSKKSPKEIRNLLSKWKIPWEDGMQAGWFPFVSSPQGLLLRIRSVKTFQKIFTMDRLVESIIQQTSSRSK
jgi:hypothetical protein